MHLKLIVPREKRVLSYYVLEGVIINENQRLNNPELFNFSLSRLVRLSYECILNTTEKENLYSFIYIHPSGEFETEMNSSRPKYQMHPRFNDED